MLMQQEKTSDNKRLAKNTVVLYVRTIILMLVSLYTSRVILDVLGVDDYGIYNVVGGAIMMFSVVSGSISNAISRFITFELGKGDYKKLKEVFVSSVNIQIGISLIVIILGETFGLWFLNSYMNIPDGRMYAANWVLHCSLIAFIINLLSIPYNACIIAHEKMTAFAYIGILDALLKLLVVVALPFFLHDKLIVYSLLIVFVALVIRIVYAIYCSRHFEECHYHYSFNRMLIREMAGFSGWQFLTNTCWIFNTQGINILSNIYFGVAVNAARGIASHVEGAVMQFVNNFTMALNPQLVKSYAQGEKTRFFSLICQGAKFSYYLFLLLALPIIIETEFILGIWLKEIPDQAVMFVRLSIIAAMANMLGNTGVASCMATGNIKHYTLVISSFGVMVLPLTWVAFIGGFPASAAYIVFIVIYIVIVFVRLHIMKGLINFPPILFIKTVIIPIFFVTLFTIVFPIYVHKNIEEGFLRFFFVTLVAISSALSFIYMFGLTASERSMLTKTLVNILNRHIKE